MSNSDLTAESSKSVAVPCMQKCIAGIERILHGTIAIVVLFVMGLTCLDVVFRYVLSRPITGSSELIQFAMAILIFTAFPLVCYREENITVTLLQGRVHGITKWLLRFGILLVCLLTCAAMAWQVMINGYELIEDQTVTMVLGLPLGYLNYFIGIFCALTCLVFLLLLGQHCKKPQRVDRR